MISRLIRTPAAIALSVFLLSPSLDGRHESAYAGIPTLRETLATPFAALAKPWTGRKRRALLVKIETAFRGRLRGVVQTKATRRIAGGNPLDYASLARTFLGECERAGFAPELILAVIEVESGFHVSVKSPMGAVGLMQLRPIIVRDLGEKRAADLTDPEANVRYGIRYLKRLRETFEVDGLFDLFASYLVGPDRYGKLKRDPSYEPRETLVYFRRIQAKQSEWKARL